MMSELPPTLRKPFDRLLPWEVARLEAALDGEDVLVKGLHTKEVEPYRGGCLPFVGLAGAGLMATVLAVEWPVIPWRGAALGLACACLVLLVVNFFRVRLSKRLLTRPGGWVAIGWSRSVLVHRSFQDCLLVPWAEVSRIEVLGEDAPKSLRGTLWIHLADKGRTLVLGRDGSLAGRPLVDWAADLEAARKRGSKA